MDIISTSMFGWGVPPVWFPAVLLIITVWSLFWKGLALWHSSRRKQPWWFVILLIVNTIGILEIIYLFVVAKIKPKDWFSKER